MASTVLIRPREYHDSVRLMRVSEAIRHEPGVTEAMVMMATPNNKKILATAGLMTPEVEAARPDDLVLAITAGTEEQVASTLKVAEEALAKRAGAAAGSAARTLDAALAADAAASLVTISVPGAHAYREAKRALELGLNVFLFSDNVPLEEERKLKDQAAAADRLVMGPDCGTAILGGICLGFANKVARGPVGVVGASGTGTQEITSLLDWLGTGVSHAIGTGGRDLKSAIGGATMLQALKLLAQDPATEVIVITSKPPAPEVAEKVLSACRAIAKPVIVNFIGDDRTGTDGNLTFTDTLAATAQAAARAAGGQGALPALDAAETESWLETARARRRPGQRYLRGLYAGGTLCYEALLRTTAALGPVHSNLASGDLGLPDLFTSHGHTVIDLGEDDYTQGRAHPMIDPLIRNQRILAEAADPEVALLLLDLVIGYGAHADPATPLAATLTEARAIAARDGRDLPVIVTICGTRADPQGYDDQAGKLAAAGILVARTNAEATALAALYIGGIHD